MGALAAVLIIFYNLLGYVVILFYKLIDNGHVTMTSTDILIHSSVAK